MIIIYILIIILLVLNILPYFINFNKNNNYTFYGTKNKYILTKNELHFFHKLKEITDKYNLYIFPKIRLADIIDTSNYSNFNKIKSKHIDFTICNRYCSPILYIELDDKSHYNYRNKENDIKKDYIMERVNANLIRIKTNEINLKLQFIENLIVSNNNIKIGN